MCSGALSLGFMASYALLDFISDNFQSSSGREDSWDTYLKNEWPDILQSSKQQASGGDNNRFVKCNRYSEYIGRIHGFGVSESVHLIGLRSDAACLAAASRESSLTPEARASHFVLLRLFSISAARGEPTTRPVKIPRRHH